MGSFARLAFIAVIGLGATTIAPMAQTALSGASQLSNVAVIEVDRMFSDSIWGKRVAADIQAAVTELETQNRQLETDLAVEEAELTEMRLSTEPAEFAVLADAFDEKVRAIRDATENKVTALNQIQQTEFNKFRVQSEGILLEVANEINARVILDRRSVYYVVQDTVNITDQVISRVDSAFGDGSDVE